MQRRERAPALHNWSDMNLFELTRALVDIESVTNNEKQVGDFLFDDLFSLASRHAGSLERIPVAAGRDNIFACWGEPVVTLSTHMDTVPPFFGSNEDDEFLWGRGDEKFRPALCRWRRAQLRRGESCGGNTARFAVFDQRGAYREPSGARLQRGAAF